ncbi:adenylate/guanylate cyclase domain-containing protein [Bacteroidota bacterium]
MDITNVAVITLAYLMISWFITIYNHSIILSNFSLGPSEQNNFTINFLINTLIGFIAGVSGGALLVTVNNKIFRKRSFRYAMLTTASGYVLIFLFITTLVSVITAILIADDSSTFGNIMKIVFLNFTNPTIIVYFFMWGTITLFTLFYLQINDKFGPGILSKFLMGKYHHPREEERIFMFLDMKSSTAIAEKIGNEKYFSLLNDVFSDITNAIIASEGEIYQYVGDEIVISWTMKKGVTNANCLQCFNNIQKRINELSKYYNDKFGLVPEFKAGLHYGKVTAGEVGSIKKDIVYSGDVLNTTSRIQEQCNHHNVNFIISRQTFDLIEDKTQFELIHLGNIELRGKQDKIDLNTIRLV